MPVISIIIPTYKRIGYLEETLQSCLMQKGFGAWDIELIVSDNDPSSDEVGKMLEKYQNSEMRILYNQNIENIGPIANCNKALSLKRAPYFVILSDDDLFYDEKSLSHLYRSLVEHPEYDCAVWKLAYIDSEWNSLSKTHPRIIPSLHSQLRNHTIGFWGILYKDVGIRYKTEAGLYGDYCFNLDYIAAWHAFVAIEEHTFKYRLHNSQSINTISVWRDLDIYRQMIMASSVPSYWKIPYLLRRWAYTLGFLIKKSVASGK